MLKPQTDMAGGSWFLGHELSQGSESEPGELSIYLGAGNCGGKGDL